MARPSFSPAPVHQLKISRFPVSVPLAAGAGWLPHACRSSTAPAPNVTALASAPALLTKSRRVNVLGIPHILLTLYANAGHQFERLGCSLVGPGVPLWRRFGGLRRWGPAHPGRRRFCWTLCLDASPGPRPLPEHRNRDPGARPHVELLPDPFDVPLRSPLGDLQVLSDLPIGHAQHNEVGNLEFPR